MKRMGALFLLFSLLILWGCSGQPEAEQLQSPMKFYYKTLDENYGTVPAAMESELREVYGHETDYLWVLTEYFQGPRTSELTAPFQKATTVVSADLQDTQLRLNVSAELSELSGVDLTLACACIAMTCLEFPGVESVSIRASGRRLGGQQELVLSRSSLLLEDTGASRIGASYTLYFSDLDNRYLIEEQANVDCEEEDLPACLIDRLLDGPMESGLAETMPLGTSLLALEVTDGVCTVDLSPEFLANAPRSALAQRMTVLSLTNTLTQLDGIDALVLYVGGELLSQYGAMDLSQPLTFESGAVGPVRVGLNEFDADLYLTIGSSRQLSRLPIRIRQTASEVPAERVIQALLSYTDQNGYHNPVPAGTALLSVRREGAQYVVDLSPEFLSAAETGTLDLAVRAVAAVVLDLGDCSTVRITVSGTVPEGEFGSLFSAQTWNDSWIAE